MAIEEAGYAVWQGERTWNGVAILRRCGKPVFTRRCRTFRDRKNLAPGAPRIEATRRQSVTSFSYVSDVAAVVFDAFTVPIAQTPQFSGLSHNSFTRRHAVDVNGT